MMALSVSPARTVGGVSMVVTTTQGFSLQGAMYIFTITFLLITSSSLVGSCHLLANPLGV
jgi:hypothetical protein